MTADIPVVVEVVHTYVVWVDPDMWSGDHQPIDSASMAKVLRDYPDSYEFIPDRDPKTRACAAAGETDYEWREAESWDLALYCEHRVPRDTNCDPCMQRESAAHRARLAAAEAT